MKYNLTNAFLAWKPRGRVEVLPAEDHMDVAGTLGLDKSWGCCNPPLCRLPLEDRAAKLCVKALRDLIFRDRCSPEAVHQAISQLEEYERIQAAEIDPL